MKNGFFNILQMLGTKLTVSYYIKHGLVETRVLVSPVCHWCPLRTINSAETWSCSIPVTCWSFLQILCDLLSPADGNVKVGLRETTQNTLPHLRSKALVADARAPAKSPVQRQHQQQLRATSAHNVDNQEVPEHWIKMLKTHSFLIDWFFTVFVQLKKQNEQRWHNLTFWSSVVIQKRWESLERPVLSRAQSLRMHGSGSGEEGLKRVSSAPQLGDQDKGSLLKRKLSVSDMESYVVDSGSSKHKKQGWLPSHGSSLLPIFPHHVIAGKIRCNSDD